VSNQRACACGAIKSNQELSIAIKSHQEPSRTCSCGAKQTLFPTPATQAEGPWVTGGERGGGGGDEGVDDGGSEGGSEGGKKGGSDGGGGEDGGLKRQKERQASISSVSSVSSILRHEACA
jgi:hypothetical protein